MSCAHSQIEAALDRWSECHWHVHQMEANYHSPDSFRYAFNSFLRAIKEIPQILQMELQNHPMYQAVFKTAVTAARSNPLLELLHKQRDFLVHQGMLEIESNGRVGTTEGRGIKIVTGFQVSPSETTQEAYERFKEFCRRDNAVREMFGPDCDSWPFISREWKIPELPNTELLEVALDAWHTTGSMLSQIVVGLGGEPLDLSFSCRHEPDSVRTVQFSQREFFLSVDGIDINVNQVPDLGPRRKQ